MNETFVIIFFSKKNLAICTFSLCLRECHDVALYDKIVEGVLLLLKITYITKQIMATYGHFINYGADLALSWIINVRVLQHCCSNVSHHGCSSWAYIITFLVVDMEYSRQNISIPWLPKSWLLMLLGEITIMCTHNFSLVTPQKIYITIPTRLICSGASGIVTGCYGGVWSRELTTSPLYVGMLAHLFGISLLNRLVCKFDSITVTS